MYKRKLINDVLRFWFEDKVDYNKWFFKTSQHDNFIRSKFYHAVREANKGYFLDWLQSPDSYLASIILLHYLPKFIFRNTPCAYRMDKKCILFIEMGLDLHLRHLTTSEQVTVLLCYSTLENISGQRFAIDNLKCLLGQPVNATDKSLIRRAIRHHENAVSILLKFNRFPERNILYNQESSEEEIDYMDELQSLEGHN